MKLRTLLAAIAVSGALLAPAEAKVRQTRPATTSRKAPKSKAATRRAPKRLKIKRQKPRKPVTRPKASRAN